MGSITHETLEKLYTNLKYQKTDTLEELLIIFDKLWDNGCSDNIIINKPDYTYENYRLMGKKFVTDYYNRFHPFDQMIILGLETEDSMNLPDGNGYHVRIDKLGRIGKDYYVCDYKTNNKIKTQPEADEDRQLAMYSKWVRDNYPDAENVYLLWHMLAFDSDVISKRTEEELDAMIENTVDRISEIENCEEWETNVSNLCDYCVYKDICPEFSHLIKLEEKSEQEYSEDAGLKAVDEYDSVLTEMKKLENRKEELEAFLTKFASKEGIERVYGTDVSVSVKESSSVELPKDKTELIDVLKSKGLYDEFTMLNHSGLRAKLLKKEITDQEILQLVEFSKSVKISLKKK